jgi:hypothetical protein
MTLVCGSPSCTKVLIAGKSAFVNFEEVKKYKD